MVLGERDVIGTSADPDSGWLILRIRKTGVLGAVAMVTVVSVVLSNAIGLSIGFITGVSLREYLRANALMSTLIPALVAPIVSGALFRLLFQLDAAKRELEIVSMTDPLTGAHNRRHFFRAGEQQAAKAAEATTVMMLDIDHFKHINDAHGHDAGDAVLCGLVARIKACLRRDDVFARTGGEEFSLILPRTGLEEARVVAERVRHAVAAAAFDGDGGPPVFVTISAGLAEVASGEDFSAAMKRADRQLYRAKSSGRNRVCWETEPAGQTQEA